MIGTVEHRVAVVMCADVVGYSRLMGIDEEGTLAALQTVRRELAYPEIARHRGRIVRTSGDGLVVEFTSVLDAVHCAVAMQRAIAEHEAERPADRRIRFRVGINMGDIVSDGDVIYGEGMLVAAGLEGLAEPGGINLSRAVRDQVRDRLPLVLDDLGEHEIANAPRPVRVFRVVSETSAPAVDAKPAASPRPAVAVLPFRNLGGDTEAEFFLDSVAEDLITELSRARWFSVVARNSSFRYKNRTVESRQVARELGVRYLVEGSLRKAGARARISCQLVEAASGQDLWAERFDGSLEDSFDLQDRIVEAVIGAVGPVLRAAEIDRARRKPEPAQDVYDLVLRASVPAFVETAEANAEALALLTRALEADRDNPAANALAAWCRQQRHLMDWPGGRADDRETAKRLARIAIDRGSDVPLALAVAGAVRAALTRDHDLALAAADRAVTINGNSALILAFDALTRCLCGDYGKAIEHAEKALRLSPLEPLVYHASLASALALLLTGRAEEAVSHAQKAIEGNRNFAFPYCVLALGLARLGRTGEAARAVHRLLRAAPGFGIGALRKIRFANAARLQDEIGSLRAAHLPE
ncbi:MAG TPA: adenylate/guanylate cyclase domain-containing protein [Stellaceae bacterium]